MPPYKSALFNRKTPGGVFAIEDQSLSTGDRYFVHSGTGSSTNSGTSPIDPMATIDQGINKMTASQGDILYVMPGHAENVTTATGIACDVIGIKIVGLGDGNDIPTVSYTAAAGSLTVSVASVTIENLKFVANFETGVTAGITVAAGGDGLTLDGLQFRDTSGTFEFKIHATIATTITDVTIKNCNFITAAGSMTSSVFFAGTSENVSIENNFWFVDCSASVIDHLTAICTAISITGNQASNVDTGAGLCIGLKSDSTSTGYIADNRLFGNKNDSEPLAATNDFVVVENYVSNTLNASGVLNPGAGAVP
jgi:hypothetical protein